VGDRIFMSGTIVPVYAEYNLASKIGCNLVCGT